LSAERRGIKDQRKQQEKKRKEKKKRARVGQRQATFREACVQEDFRHARAIPQQLTTQLGTLHNGAKTAQQVHASERARCHQGSLDTSAWLSVLVEQQNGYTEGHVVHHSAQVFIDICDTVQVQGA
jgi:hypothetical protein